jgi:hypothetical protein
MALGVSPAFLFCQRGDPGFTTWIGLLSWVIIGVEVDTMATNLSLDPELLEKALEVSGEKTKKAAVTKAFKEFISRREQLGILELFGTLEWDEEYSYKKERCR